MHLALDAVGARFGGTAMVAVEVVRASLHLPWVDRVTLFVTPQKERRFELPSDARLDVVDVAGAAHNSVRRIAWQLVQARRAARALGARMLIGLSNGGVGSRRTPAAVFLQQSLPFSAEALERVSPAMRLRMRAIAAVMRVSAHKACAVGVQTNVMREAVIDRFGIAPEKVHVFAPGAPSFPAAATHGRALALVADVPRGCRVLYVGSDLGYKNVRAAFEAIAVLRQRIPQAHLIATLASTSASSVIAIGDVERAELRALYEQCDVLLMPSLVETIGLPMLEAMQLGLPVVAADRPYAREVCGDAALYVDPNRPSDIGAALARVLLDEPFRLGLREAGRERSRARTSEHPYERLITTFAQAAHL